MGAWEWGALWVLEKWDQSGCWGNLGTGEGLGAGWDNSGML